MAPPPPSSRSLLRLLRLAVTIASSCAPAATTASALPWPATKQEDLEDAQRSPRAGTGLLAVVPRATTTTKTGMPAWQIVCIPLGLFFGVMALGMVGGALEVLLHTRKKVADPDPAELDFGRSRDEGEGEGEGTDSDMTAVEEEGSSVDGHDVEKGPSKDRFSWQDEQGVQMEVWDEDGPKMPQAPAHDDDDAAKEEEEDEEDEDAAQGYPRRPAQAYAGGAGDDNDDEYYRHYQQQHDGTAHEKEEEEEEEDQGPGVRGQRMTQYEPWVPHMDDDEFQDVVLPAHGAQSETTHRQHPAEYI